MKLDAGRLAREILEYYVQNSIPSELDQLSSATHLEDVTDLEIEQAVPERGGLRVTGHGTFDVKLEYGGGDARDGLTNLDSYPFTFEAVVSQNSELVELVRVKVDTSSFYE